MKLLNNSSKKIVALSYLCMAYESGSNMLLSASKEMLSAHLGVGLSSISMLITIRSISAALFLFLTARMSDKYGRKAMIISGVILYILYHILLPLQLRYLAVVLLVIMVGLAYSLMDPSGQALLFDSFDDATPAMPFVQVVFAGSGFLIPILISFGLQFGISWKAMYWTYGSIGIALFIYALLLRYPPRNQKTKSSQKKQQKFTTEPSLKREGALLSLFIILAGATSALLTTWIDVYMKEIYLFSDAKSIRMLSLFQLGCMIGAVAMFFVLQKINVSKVILICESCAAATFLIGYLLQNKVVFMLAVVLTGFFSGTIFNMTIGLGGELFGNKTGTITAILSASTSISMAGSVALSSILYDRVGVRSTLGILCFTLTIGVVIAFIIRKRYQVLTGNRIH